jgi:hypothetical protein
LVGFGNRPTTASPERCRTTPRRQTAVPGASVLSSVCQLREKLLRSGRVPFHEPANQPVRCARAHGFIRPLAARVMGGVGTVAPPFSDRPEPTWRDGARRSLEPRRAEA